jgi:signal transduction histidine kinase
LGNAFKFVLEGLVTVGIKMISESSMEIYVKDTGIGIKDEDKPKLLKAFGKLEEDD